MSYDLGVMRPPANILFGPGQRRSLGAAAAGLGSRALVCTDARFASLAVMTEIRADLAQHGVETAIFDGTEPELPLRGVLACVEAYREFAPDIVIGVGGGSCLDMAKLVSLLLTHGGALSDYYGEFKVPGPIRPVIAVPTTSGTGSEVTPVAVLADPEREMKVGVSSPELIPRTAICDPELTLTCPAGLTAISGADALAHAIEAFAAVNRATEPLVAFERVFVGKNALSDQNALAAIRLLVTWLPRAVADGRDLQARNAVMLGSTLAGLAFGTAGTSAAHALQYPIGAITHTAHGLGVGVLLPYAMDYNLPAAAETYAEIAAALGRAGLGAVSDDARAVIRVVRELFAEIGLPNNLAALGFGEDRIDWAAERAMSATRLVSNNPRALDKTGAADILRHALAGHNL